MTHLQVVKSSQSGIPLCHFIYAYHWLLTALLQETGAETNRKHFDVKKQHVKQGTREIQWHSNNISCAGYYRGPRLRLG